MAIYSLGGRSPQLGKDTFVAETAAVIGDVVLGDQASVWFGTVIRGDMHSIRIGARTNIQDNSLVHVTTGLFSTTIGEDITVGHSVILHGCVIGDRCLIGMGSIVLDGAEIGEEAIVGAGSLVTPNTKIPPRCLVMGRPARVVREVTENDRLMVQAAGLAYVENGARFARELTRIG